MAIDLDQNKIDVAKIDQILKDNGASEVNQKTFDEA
jgi:hypothetical protein